MFNSNDKIIKKVLTSLLFTLSLLPAAAQQDTSYYRSYPNQVTGRFYFSQKYTAFRLRHKSENYTLNYSPNTNLNMGIGATYKWATLNLAYGFEFLNPDKQKGKTRYLDLQFHGYGKKIVIDFLGQFYRGFYLYPKGTAAESGEFYKRPDLHVNLIGLSGQYVFNHKRFSFRSAVFQNEWQRKSAGTFLAGVESHVGSVKADSTITPYVINAFIAGLNEKQTNFFDIGINAGYAYSWIIKQNYFVTASATLSLDYGFSSLRNDNVNTRNSGFTSNTIFRLGTGYNSTNWGISLVFVNADVRLARAKDHGFSLHAGNLRLNGIYRFKPGKRGKKILKEVDKAIR